MICLVNYTCRNSAGVDNKYISWQLSTMSSTTATALSCVDDNVNSGVETEESSGTMFHESLNDDNDKPSKECPSRAF